VRTQKIWVLRGVFEPKREKFMVFETEDMGIEGVFEPKGEKIMVFETEDMGIEESIRTKGGENDGV